MRSGPRLTKTSRVLVFSFIVPLSLALSVGCVTSKMGSTSISGSGGGNGGSGSGGGSSAGSLAVGPATMSFGNVTVGSSKDQTGTLSAASGGVTVSTASWNGTGYSVSGISFPVTIAAGQSVPFTVTFAPQAVGATTGTISFVSDATNSAGGVALSGTGVQTSQHNVTLGWNSSTSSVQGYYVYRGSASGGPYARISPLETGLSYVDTSVTSGQTYYYAVTALGAGNVESGYSNQASASIP